MNDSSLCDQVKDSDSCWYDHALAQNSSALCYNMDDNQRCLYNVAANTNNLALCTEIESINEYTCQIKIAKNLNDSSICDELPNTFMNVTQKSFDLYTIKITFTAWQKCPASSLI